MPDNLSVAERSARMSLVRSSGTKPESRLYTLLRRALPSRYRIVRHERRLPGVPDVVVPELQLIVFAHGCFWHRCPAHARTPKSRVSFWARKLDANARRDRATARQLRSLGWSVWVVWEHDLTATRLERTSIRLQSRLARHIKNSGSRD